MTSSKPPAPTAALSPGDVVLVRFPFTDLSSAKQRPAVVVCPAGFASKHGDVVVVAVTGSKQADPALALDEWRAAGLMKPTWFKPLMATLSSDIIARKLGTLAPADHRRLAGVLDVLIEGSLRPLSGG
jgi:mRNA interferase MazF